MRVPFVAGNWKLNKTAVEASKLVYEMLPGLKLVHGVEKVLCPPFTALMTVYRMVRDTDIGLGGQNMYWEDKGAFTGEVSALMLLEFCRYVILGHSERRTHLGETDEMVNRKVSAALLHNLIPILCVGETLEENKAGKAAEVVSRQVKAGLAGVDVAKARRVVIAYEPVWAIGTGRAATPTGVSALIRNVIRPTLSGLFSEQVAQAVRVLYGGSVDPKNAVEFFKKGEIDGALVGGASLDARKFIQITEAAAARFNKG